MGFFDKVAKGLSSGWFGNLVGGISSLYSTYSNNQNIEKSLEAQSKENEKTRQYNLQLAQQQNQWNIEQWQRANDYNDPSAQLARLHAAGLNPDMVYGQSGISNTAVSSPEMTSGAPASPVDYSSLANKRSLADVVNQSLQWELQRAQIDKVKSETKQQNIQNDISSFNKEIVDYMRENGFHADMAEARKAKEVAEAKLEEAKGQSEAKRLQVINEELRHNKVINEFEESLNPKKREQFEALTKKAVHDGNVAAYLDETKALDFWTNKGMDAVNVVLGIVAARFGMSLPTRSKHRVTTKDGDSSYTEEWYE